MRLLRTKPHGGGPAPLLYNPIKQWLHVLVGLHLILMLVACVNFFIPLFWDIDCSLLNTTTYASLCAVVAFFMSLYFCIFSTRKWGTEKQWSIVSLITLSVAVVDLGTSGWGIYILYVSSNAIYGPEDAPDSCLTTKASVFYYCSAIVIATHLVVAFACGALAVALFRRISIGLNDLRDLT